MIGRLLDTLLGPKCERCRGRVFPNDQDQHTKDCSRPHRCHTTTTPRRSA